MPDKAIVLDANILILLVVGSASVAYISSHKRLHAYAEDDFRLLTRLLATTPKNPGDAQHNDRGGKP